MDNIHNWRDSFYPTEWGFQCFFISGALIWLIANHFGIGMEIRNFLRAGEFAWPDVCLTMNGSRFCWRRLAGRIWLYFEFGVHRVEETDMKITKIKSEESRE